jgi:hypothetical protein
MPTKRPTTLEKGDLVLCTGGIVRRVLSSRYEGNFARVPHYHIEFDSGFSWTPPADHEMTVVEVPLVRLAEDRCDRMGREIDHLSRKLDEVRDERDRLRRELDLLRTAQHDPSAQ